MQRHHFLTVRVNEDERTTLRQAALILGITQSELVRAASLVLAKSAVEQQIMRQEIRSGGRIPTNNEAR